MGSAFWIFIIIAVIQGVASVAAKSAEKRKKAERRAEIARQDASGEGARPVGKFRPQEELEKKLDPQGDAQKFISAMLGFPQEAAQPTKRPPKAAESSVAVSATTDPATIRQNRLKELRRQRARNAAANPTAPRASNTPAASPGPSRPSPPVAPDAGRPQPSASPSQQPPSQSQRRRRRDEQKAVETVHPPTRDTAIVARSPQAIGDPAKDLPRLWRNPRSIRQAILLSELLQPPVALRNHQAGGFGESVVGSDGGRSD